MDTITNALYSNFPSSISFSSHTLSGDCWKSVCIWVQKLKMSILFWKGIETFFFLYIVSHFLSLLGLWRDLKPTHVRLQMANPRNLNACHPHASHARDPNPLHTCIIPQPFTKWNLKNKKNKLFFLTWSFLVRESWTKCS